MNGSMPFEYVFANFGRSRGMISMSKYTVHLNDMASRKLPAR